MYYDADLLEFVSKEYPQYLPLYSSLHGVYMADMARVLVVYHHGISIMIVYDYFLVYYVIIKLLIYQRGCLLGPGLLLVNNKSPSRSVHNTHTTRLLLTNYHPRFYSNYSAGCVSAGYAAIDPTDASGR